MLNITRIKNITGYGIRHYSYESLGLGIMDEHYHDEDLAEYVMDFHCQFYSKRIEDIKHCLRPISELVEMYD